MLRRSRPAVQPVVQCTCLQHATYFSRRVIPPPPAQPGTYEDILELQEEIYKSVWTRGDLRKKTLPLQVVDNRTRAEHKIQNWKLRCFDRYREIVARPELTEEELQTVKIERQAVKDKEQKIKDNKKQWRLDNAEMLTQARAEKKLRDAHKKVIKDIRSVGENTNPPIDEFKRERWQEYQDKKNEILVAEGFSPGQEEEDGTELDRRRMKGIIKQACEELAPARKLELARQEAELRKEAPSHKKRWDERGRTNTSGGAYAFL